MDVTDAMRSLRRIVSWRANGAVVRGLETPEGKRRSSQNALRHGLLSDCEVLHHECREGSEEFLAQHLERFAPLDGVEFGMIEEMAACSWRLRRAWLSRTTFSPMASMPSPPAMTWLALALLCASSSLPGRSPAAPLRNPPPLMSRRALDNIVLLRAAGIPNEPSPNFGHSQSDS